KNLVYNDSQIEKVVRGTLKTEVTRLINNNDLVVLDASNYIKGYRYELYCISKQLKTPHCVIQCVTPITEAWTWNELRPEHERYSKEIFDALILRYEAPDSRNRWDSPMFTILPEDDIPFSAIYDALFERKPPPPNQSTQLQPLSSNNFVHLLDKCTQEVVSAILTAQKITPEGEIKIPDVSETLILPKKLSLAELSRARRQFIAYTKSHPVEDSIKIKILFIQYLNKTIN
ncbi:UNVERIFIED_CONTAM: hypothetical protein GTU68_016641, partial [Idotea baltica]|nr:hypothetical protein [Idotea baltica]